MRFCVAVIHSKAMKSSDPKPISVISDSGFLHDFKHLNNKKRRLDSGLLFMRDDGMDFTW